jgi:putative ABC transport system permease protein
VNAKPPVLPRIALRLVVRADRREEIEGDLLELFHDRLSQHGLHRARLLYWLDALSLVRRPPRLPRRDGMPYAPQEHPMSSIPSTIVHELRYAGRNLAKRPGYAAIAAITLALGIGSTVSIFTVLNAIVLRPLPYPDADRLVEVLHHAPGMRMPVVRSSTGLVARYREHARTMASIAGYNTRQLNLQRPAGSEQVRAIVATPDLFATLATPAALGRVFTADDASPGSQLATILTDDFWRQRFSADPAVIGQTVQLDGQPATVVGVMPRGFAFPDPATRLFVPMRSDPMGTFGTLGTVSIARLAPRATIEDARRELEQLQRRVPEWFPDLTREELSRLQWSVSVEPLRAQVVGSISSALWMLFAIVGFVLLIAAANVANLFLVRAESRQREIAVRSALGASRGRIAATFLAEGLVLAALGAAGGVGIAQAGTRLLVDYGPARLPRLHEVQLDTAGIAFAALMSVLAAALVAALPTLTVARRSVAVLLREAGRGNTSGAGRRARHALIVTQVAMALVLLVGAGLMLRSVVRLSAVDPGFRVQGLLTAGMSAGAARTRASTNALYTQVVDKMAATPGARGAGAATSLPLGATGLTGAGVDMQSRPELHGRGPNAMYSGITAEYLQTLGVPFLAGRVPARDDIEQNRPLAWVNKTFARQFLGDRALGERIRVAGSGWLEVVGVVGDMKTGALRDDVQPMVYVPFTNSAVKPTVMFAVVRTTGDPTSIASAVREAVNSVDASVPLALRTMDDIHSASLAQSRFTVVLLSLAAVIGLALGIVGLYGAISYTVAQRTAEIGVRVALGANPAAVCAMVLRQGISIILLGIAIGLAAAGSLARYIASMLFEVSTFDPLTYAAVTLLLVSVGVLATFVPARRAADTNPVDALRVAQ